MAKGYSLVIQATDKFTGVFDKMNARLEGMRQRAARATASFDKLGQSVKKFGDLSGFTQVSNGFAFLAGKAKDAAGHIAKMALGIGALTAGGIAAGVYRLASNWARFGTQLDKDAKRIGTSADVLRRWQSVAELAGATAEDMTGALQHLGDTMQDAVTGRNNDALRVFQSLGIDIESAAWKAKTGAERFEAVRDALRGLEDPRTRATYGNMLLGGSYEKLAPLVGKSREELEALKAEADRLAPTNLDAIEQSKKLSEAQERLGLAFKGLGDAIMSKVGPHITPLVDRFTEFLFVNKDLIALRIEEYFNKAVELFKEWGPSVLNCVEAVGGLGNVLTGLFAIMTGGFAVKILGPFLRLAKVLLGITSTLGAMGAIKLATFAASVEGLRRVIKGEDEEEAQAKEEGRAPVAGPLQQRFASPVDRLLTWGARQVFGGSPATSQGGTFARPGSAPPATGNGTPMDGSLAQRQDEIVEAAKRAGFSEKAAIAIAANATAESLAGAKPVGDNGSSGGIIHWNGPRRKAFADAHGGLLPENAPLDAQMAWLKRETEGDERARSGFAGTNDAAAGARQMSLEFVRPRTQQGFAAMQAEAAHRSRIAQDIEQRRLRAARTRMAPPATLNALQPPQAPAQGQQGAPGASGNVNLSMDFRNVPFGTVINSNATGNVTVEPPRVGYSMASIG